MAKVVSNALALQMIECCGVGGHCAPEEDIKQGSCASDIKGRVITSGEAWENRSYGKKRSKKARFWTKKSPAMGVEPPKTSTRVRIARFLSV
jgi:hypothetical protein